MKIDTNSNDVKYLSVKQQENEWLSSLAKTLAPGPTE